MRKIKFIHVALVLFGVLLVGFGVMMYLMLKVYEGPTVPGIGVSYKTVKEDLDRLVLDDFSMPKFNTQLLPLDAISVSLKDDITPAQQEDLKNFIKYMAEVREVTYVSKEQSMEEYKEFYKEDEYVIEEITEYSQYYGSPFPAEFRIKLSFGEDPDTVVERLKTRPEISEDEDGDKEIVFSYAGIQVTEWDAALRIVGSDLDTWIHDAKHEMVNKRRIALWTYVGASIVIIALFFAGYGLISRKRTKAASGKDSP
jgi:heme/copper-type cytochrome/quinol oxidase subunit 3